MKRKLLSTLLNLSVCVTALVAVTFANAAPMSAPFSQFDGFQFSPDFAGSRGIRNPGIALSKIGRIIEGSNLIWGENTGWINLKTPRAELRIGSNILAGWIWIENCGWVCLGNGHPLDGKHYSNRGVHDWGINNDCHGNLSGCAWSEITGWINFSTGHSRVYLDESGRFNGYAWGENVGWMHFGPGRTVQYIAKADAGPWREIENESRRRLAVDPDDSEIRSGSFSVEGLRNNSERYNKYVATVCQLRLGSDDFCSNIRHCETPVYISGLSRLYSIRAPPLIA